MNVLDSTAPTSDITDLVIEHIMTLNDVGFGNLDDANFVANGDPIVLDLGAEGISLTDAQNGVSFDIDGDGHAEQTAWTTGEDGILALDLDGSGKIENGTELISPDFDGGNHANSIEALATLDSNGDSVIDASDSRFSELLVWTDGNHDGVSGEGELHSLADLGIEFIDLNAVFGDSVTSGQETFAKGQFTMANGETHDYVGVNFDTGSAQTALAQIEHPQQPVC